MNSSGSGSWFSMRLGPRPCQDGLNFGRRKRTRSRSASRRRHQTARSQAPNVHREEQRELRSALRCDGRRVAAPRRRVAAPPRVPACRRRVPSPLPRTVVVATAPHAHSTMEAPQEAEVDFSEVFSVDKIAYNAKALNYCRVFVAIISGCAAGILGQTGLLGFLTFFITTFLLSLTLYMKVKGDSEAVLQRGAERRRASVALLEPSSTTRSPRAPRASGPLCVARRPARPLLDALLRHHIHLLGISELELAGRCARSRASQSASRRGRSSSFCLSLSASICAS